MSIINGANAVVGSAAVGYQIERSLRFNSADSAYLNRTPASAGNRKTWTWSGWVKRGAIADGVLFSAGASSSSYINLRLQDNGGVQEFSIVSENPSLDINLRTSQQFRDPSAWYHFVFALDTTQATSSNRAKLYVNGVQVTAFSTATYPSLNADLLINNNQAHNIGRRASAGDVYFSGYLAEIHFIDGSALTPSSFGETDSDTGVWKPKAYSGSYGTNGFYLDFGDNSSTTALGYDAAGSNDWTPNNFSVTAGAGNDSLVDSPTRYGTDTGVGGEVRGNYATLNPLSKLNWISQGGTVTPSNGNLQFAVDNSGNMMDCTIAVSSGKWYWEVTQSTFILNGIRSTRGIPTGDLTYRYYQGNGQIIYVPYNTTSQTVLTTVATAASGDIIGIALDLDNRTISWYKNNSLLYTATSIVADEYAPCVGGAASSSGAFVNFGQRPFAYTAPSGFKALCTTNLPEPTIAEGRDYFNAVLYTGNSSTQSITGVGFQPDMIWVKDRSAAQWHNITDVVRGAGKEIFTNATNAEETNGGISSFNSDGFSLINWDGANKTGDSYVAWNWKANGAGVSNTAGTISSTVSANTTAGFSIITYTGNATSSQTVGHGLGVTPSFIIVKVKSTSGDWVAYHKSLGADRFLILNATNGQSGSVADYWGTPSSTTFGIKGGGWSNNFNGESHVAYCFAPIAGYSAFGSYTGNGSTDGPFVFTGFRPRFILGKRTDSTGNWLIIDTVRDTTNPDSARLFPNLSNAEDTSEDYDILSNGFKPRTAGALLNVSGATYIYAAFAENPFKFSLAR